MVFDIKKHYNSSNYVGTDFYSVNPEGTPVHPNPINLSGGRPNAGFYPIESIELRLKHNPFQELSESDANISSITINQDDDTTLDLATGLQYGPSLGHAKLLEFIDGLINELNPPQHDKELGYLVTNGSGDSLFRILQVLLDRGDTILVEEFTYTPIFGPIDALGGIKVPYKVQFENDSNVIDVDYLDELLKNWDVRYPDLKKPRLIYTVPTQNPSGLTQPLETRKRLYEIAQRYDLIILEDDPDGYIRLNDLESFKEYRENVVGNGYLNLDNDGRVIRFETFSKLYSPGLRLGFIVGLKELIDKLNEFTKVATKASSGVSQLVFYNTLKSWASEGNTIDELVNRVSIDDNKTQEVKKLVDGYLNWCFKISKEYSKRWSFVHELFKSSKSYKNGYIEPIIPDGGMFFIVKINFNPDKNSNYNYAELLESLRLFLVKHGVLVILGNLMTWDKDIAKNDANFVRLTLANVSSLDDLEIGIKRLDEGVVEYFESR